MGASFSLPDFFRVSERAVDFLFFGLDVVVVDGAAASGGGGGRESLPRVVPNE